MLAYLWSAGCFASFLGMLLLPPGHGKMSICLLLSIFRLVGASMPLLLMYCPLVLSPARPNLKGYVFAWYPRLDSFWAPLFLGPRLLLRRSCFPSPFRTLYPMIRGALVPRLPTVGNIFILFISVVTSFTLKIQPLHKMMFRVLSFIPGLMVFPF